MKALKLADRNIRGEANQNLLEAAVRWVIIIIIFVFDPLAVLLLIAANMSLVRRFGRGIEKQYDPELVKKYSNSDAQNQNDEEMDDLKKRHEVELDEFREKLSQTEQQLQEQKQHRSHDEKQQQLQEQEQHRRHDKKQQQLQEQHRRYDKKQQQRLR